MVRAFQAKPQGFILQMSQAANIKLPVQVQRIVLITVLSIIMVIIEPKPSSLIVSGSAVQPLRGGSLCLVPDRP